MPRLLACRKTEKKRPHTFNRYEARYCRSDIFNCGVCKLPHRYKTFLINAPRGDIINPCRRDCQTGIYLMLFDLQDICPILIASKCLYIVHFPQDFPCSCRTQPNSFRNFTRSRFSMFPQVLHYHFLILKNFYRRVNCNNKLNLEN